MSVIDDLVAHNDAYARSFPGGGRSKWPSRALAVVACMDSRLDLFHALGLAHGEAHIIRNAGGVVTDDVVRSLLVSQRLLATRAVMLIHHTDCGLLTFRDERRSGSGRRSRSSRSPTSTRTSVSPSPGSRRARSWPPRTTSGASSTTSTPAGCAKCRQSPSGTPSPWPPPDAHEPVGDRGAIARVPPSSDETSPFGALPLAGPSGQSQVMPIG